MIDSTRLAAVAWFLFPLAAAGACETRSRRVPDPNRGVIAEGVETDAQRNCGDNSACRADEYCGYDPGLCGRGMRPGTCRPKPTACEHDVSPMCGCDGKVYD